MRAKTIRGSGRQMGHDRGKSHGFRLVVVPGIMRKFYCCSSLPLHYYATTVDLCLAVSIERVVGRRCYISMLNDVVGLASPIIIVAVQQCQCLVELPLQMLLQAADAVVVVVVVAVLALLSNAVATATAGSGVTGAAALICLSS